MSARTLPPRFWQSSIAACHCANSQTQQATRDYFDANLRRNVKRELFYRSLVCHSTCGFVPFSPALRSGVLEHPQLRLELQQLRWFNKAEMLDVDNPKLFCDNVCSNHTSRFVATGGIRGELERSQLSGLKIVRAHLVSDLLWRRSG